MKTFDSIRALFEPGLPMAPVAPFLHGAGIFSATELATQSFRPAFSEKEPRGDAGNHNHDDAMIAAISVVVNAVTLITCLLF